MNGDRATDGATGGARDGAGPGSGGLNILVVEDHPDAARALARLLRRSGHDVRVAGTLADARAAAGDGPLDLLMSSVGLPDGSGLGLLAELRAAGRPRLRGLMLTGYGMEQDVRESLEAGYEQHLTKPVNVPELLKAIDPRSPGAGPAAGYVPDPAQDSPSLGPPPGPI